MSKLEIGDVFLIPLSNNQIAYGQYVYYDDFQPVGISEYTGHGCMVKIFNLITKEIVNIDQIINKKEMFPPVFTGLVGAINKKRWKKIGNVPVINFKYPKFRKTFGVGPGKYDDWKIWDGNAALEKLCVWGYENLEKRIETGKSGHEELI
jgi:hypothetical protein